MKTFVTTICKMIVIRASESIKNYDRFTFVLSGGRTPKWVFQGLVTDFKNLIEWHKVHCFWVDERCVPAEHPDSNYNMANNYLLKYIKPASIHRIQGELEPSVATYSYEREILSFFDLISGDIPEFDLILLGMGEDGHIASIFPDSDELKESEALVVSTKKKYFGHKRITLALPIINKSSKLLMIGNKEKLNVFMNRKMNLPVHRINEDNMRIVIQE